MNRIEFIDGEVLFFPKSSYDKLKEVCDPHVKSILEYADYLIDGPYIQELRDITLPLRGSSN